MKSLDHFKSLAGSVPGTAKSLSFSSRPASDSISSGSFANLKLIAGLIRKFGLFGSFYPKIVNIL